MILAPDAVMPRSGRSHRTRLQLHEWGLHFSEFGELSQSGFSRAMRSLNLRSVFRFLRGRGVSARGGYGFIVGVPSHAGCLGFA